MFEWLKNLFKKKIRGFEPTKNAPPDTLLPVRGTKHAAGYDFYAPYDFDVPAKGFSDLIFLNVKAYMQDDEYLSVCIRSSLATLKGDLVVAQGNAVIDTDYYSNPANDGNIGIMFYNRSNEVYHFKKGDRCCQGIFTKYLIADNDNALGERIGGYGSSGK